VGAAIEDIDINSFGRLGNAILPRLDALRTADPIHWSPASNCWFVTAHEAVTEGFAAKVPLAPTGPERIALLFGDPVERERSIGPLIQITSDFLTFKGEQEHLRVRKLLMRAFSRQTAESYRPFVGEVVEATLAAIADQSSVEFVDEVARRITSQVILRVMGLPPSYLSRLEGWSLALNEGLTGTTEKARILAANDALAEMRDFILQEVAARRATPTTDFISALLEACDGADQLTEGEVVSQVILTLIAGHDTTMNTMALSMVELSGNPGARDYIRENPDQLEQCILELMRVVAMSTSMVRVATQDFDWHDRSIRKGDIVFLMIAAANRDPAVFSDPLKLDFTRPQGANMTFAPGRHFCIGHWFAKMMLSEFFPRFLRSYDHWEVLEGLNFNSAPHFRGLQHLNVSLHR